MDDVLSGIEPDQQRRDRLRVRLRERGDLGMLYSMWVQGQDSTAIGRMLRRLALEARL